MAEPVLDAFTLDALRKLGIEDQITSMDAIIEERQQGDSEKFPMFLGVRLALELAREIRDGQTIGRLSGDLIAAWVVAYGEPVVEQAVATARVFLTRPAELREELEKRIFLPGGKSP